MTLHHFLDSAACGGGMNGPFKFFVNTPAHFLPDPATPAVQPSADWGVARGSGVQKPGMKNSGDLMG